MVSRARTRRREACRAAIAAGVVKYASRENLGRQLSDKAAEELVAAAMWYPDYIPIEAVE